MVRLLAALCLCIAGCGTDIDPKELGEPCTRDVECLEPLLCLAGVCSDRPTGE